MVLWLRLKMVECIFLFVSLGESLDINVTWNAENKSVTFVKEGKQKTLRLKLQ